MDVLYEITKIVGYTSLGFLAGYQVCKMRRNVEEIKEAVVEHSHKGGEGGQGGSGGIGGPGGGGGHGGQGGSGGSTVDYTGRGWQGRVLGLLLLILSLATLVSYIVNNGQNRRNAEHDAQVVACQAQYNRDFARAVTLRGQFADIDRQELYKMISTVITEPDALKRRQAVENWVKVTEQNEKLRKNTPLPNLETRDCGEPIKPPR